MTHTTQSHRYLLAVQESAASYDTCDISDSQTAADCLRKNWTPDLLIRESFVCLVLDRGNRTIGHMIASVGGVSATVVDPKVIFSFALSIAGASSIIMCHNHPSGRAFPSDTDRSMTKKLVAAGQVLDMQVVDHIIITENDYYSFADNGLI